MQEAPSLEYGFALEGVSDIPESVCGLMSASPNGEYEASALGVCEVYFCVGVDAYLEFSGVLIYGTYF